MVFIRDIVRYVGSFLGWFLRSVIRHKIVCLFDLGHFLFLSIKSRHCHLGYPRAVFVCFAPWWFTLYGSTGTN